MTDTDTAAMKPLATLLLLLALLHAALPAQAQPVQPKRVAVLVGNAAYQSEARLANPHNDVALLARTLREDLKFTEVIERRDLTRRQLVDLVREVRQKAAGADAVVVYYSGHGMQGPNGNFLIPVDARIEHEDHVASEGLNARELVEALRSAGPRVALLVLDAYRDSPYSRRTRSATKGLSRMNVSGGNLLVAYATVEGTTADDGAPGNSPYARALAEHLRQTELPVLEQFDAVRRTTLRLTGNKQSPTREGDLEARTFLLNPFAPVTPANRDAVEDEAWVLCRHGSTKLPCEDYLSGWPGGRYVALARTRIRDLDAAAAAAAAAAASQRPPTPVPAAPQAGGAAPTAAGQVLEDCDVCPALVAIAPGRFLMGSPASEPGRQADEEQRWVTIGRAYAIGKYEVTQAQWRAVMGSNPSVFKGCDDCPVEKVSWDDVQQYLKRLNDRTGNRFGFRLPSEAEWEYAARATTSTPFWTGGTLTTDQANFDGNRPYNGSVKGRYRARTTPVTTFPASPWGLHDMHGNVWEWVQDCYGPYSQAPTDGTAKEGAGCSVRVLRGGSWDSEPTVARSAYRLRSAPAVRDDSVGFRLARMLP